LEEATLQRETLLGVLSAFATIVENRQEHYKKCMGLADDLNRTATLNPCRPVEEDNNSVDSLATMYKVLSDSGLLSKLSST